MRERAGEVIGDNLHTELAPMTVRNKSGHLEVKQVLLSILPNLWPKLLDLNYRYDKYSTRLTPVY